MTYLATGGFQIPLATGDILRFDGAQSEAFWRACCLSGSDTITGSDAADCMFTGHGNNVVMAGAGDAWIDIRLERNGGHTVTGGEGADTFTFFAPSNRAWSATHTDFDARDDSFLIDGQDGFQLVGLTPHWLLETETGVTVNLIGSAKITFDGYTAEELRALIPDLIIG